MEVADAEKSLQQDQANQTSNNEDTNEDFNREREILSGQMSSSSACFGKTKNVSDETLKRTLNSTTQIMAAKRSKKADDESWNKRQRRA